MPNSQPLQKPSLRVSQIGARVGSPPHQVGPTQRNPHSFYSKRKEETRLGPFGNNSEGKQALSTMGHAGRHTQAKHVLGSSFVDHVTAPRQSTAFSPDTVTQEWNNDAYGISATVSISGSPAGSNIKSMSVDDGSPNSRRFRKRSSRMSVDPCPLTGTYRKPSSHMSVDPSPPNVDKNAQRKASSHMSVDAPSARRSKASSDRMLIDEIQYHYPTQNLPQQAHSHRGPSFSPRPTISPTTTCSRNNSVHFLGERTLASEQGSRSPPTSPDAIHRLSPTSGNRVHARGSSSEDNNSDKQDGQPIALLFIDSHATCDTSPQTLQLLSPINEAWLLPMEKQLEMAHRSQLKAKFRRFKAFIGGAINEIKETIRPYHKNHRKRKVTHANANLQPFSGVPDYLRSIERYTPQKTTYTSRSQRRTSPDIGNDINHVAQSWTKLAVCDSPTDLRGDNGLSHGEVP